MKTYITLCYTIKYGDISLFCHAIREVCVIIQAVSTFKSKYSYKMMRQMHIFDIKVANPILQKAYLANFLVNF